MDDTRRIKALDKITGIDMALPASTLHRRILVLCCHDMTFNTEAVLSVSAQMVLRLAMTFITGHQGAAPTRINNCRIGCITMTNQTA